MEKKDEFLNKKKHSKISVVISSYNRGMYLDFTLPTLFNQNLAKDDYEIIVVDDRSTDNTKEIVKKYKGYCDLRYISLLNTEAPKVDKELESYLEKKGEFGGTDFEYRNCSLPKNVGLKNAKYDLIMFTDPEIFHLSDSMVLHLYLQNVSLKDEIIIRESVLAGYVYGKVEDSGRPKEKAFFDDFLSLREKNLLEVRALAQKHDLRLIREAYPFNIAIEKNFLMNIGGWNESFIAWGFEDNDILQRAGLKGLIPMSFDRVENSLLDQMHPCYVHLWHPTTRINNNTYNRLLSEKNLKEYYEKKDESFLIANKGKNWGEIR